ncbi:MAG TPA: hypothetical protein VF845_04680 [Terriglobales bacterium]
MSYANKSRIRAAMAAAANMFQRLVQRPLQAPMQVGDRHRRGPIHARCAMQVQSVSGSQDSLHRGHTLGQFSQEFKTIKIGHGQIREVHAGFDRGTPFALDRTFGPIVFRLKAENRSDIQRLQLLEVVVVQRSRPDE